MCVTDTCRALVWVHRMTVTVVAAQARCACAACPLLICESPPFPPHTNNTPPAPPHLLMTEKKSMP